MSFLDQFSVWEILVGLVLILVVNTVLFKLVVDWNQAQPADDGDPIAAVPPGSAAVSMDDLEASSSFANAAVPSPNRPRRRKHLQPAATSPEPSALATPTGVETVRAPDRPMVQDPVAQPSAGEELQATAAAVAPVADVHPAEVTAPVEPARPMVTFNPEVDHPGLPAESSREPATILSPLASAEPEPSEEERSPASAPASVSISTVTTTPVAEVPVLDLGAFPAEPPVAHPPSHSLTAVKIAPEPTAAEPPAPAEPASPMHAGEITPSSDLVLPPEPLASVPEPAAPLTPSEPSPQPAASEVAAAPSEARTTSARSSFRRAVAPARLFLTREFSSVRIRARQSPAPETVVIPPVTPAPAPAPEAETAPAALLPTVSLPTIEVEPATLRSSEPATAAEPLPSDHPAPAAEVIVPEPDAEPALPPTAAEVVPPAETVTPAEPPAPEPPHTVEAAAPEPVPSADIAVAAPAPAPTVEAETTLPDPETTVPVSAPVLAAADAPGAATPPAIHVPEPSESLPVVDITPEPVNLPPLPPEPARPIQPKPVATQTTEPFIPIPTMATVQPVTGERATAQLTLSLEVASLQLTPAFRLGSVQLRPLSNVVSLQLGAGVGPQPANNPLSANISFEIQSVQTGDDGQIHSLVLKPLPQARADTTPQPRLQVDAVQLTRGVENAPIQITPAQATSTAVQLLTTYTIAGIDFTPLFEIGTMRLEPATRTVMLRLNQPGSADLPPAFEIANVQVGSGGQITLMQLTPTAL